MRILEIDHAVLYFDHDFGNITLWICQTSQKVYQKKIHFNLHTNLKFYRIYFKMLSINESISMVLYMAMPLNQSKEDCLFSFNNQLPLTTRLPWSACGLKNNLSQMLAGGLS